MVMAMTGSLHAQGSNNSFWKTNFYKEIFFKNRLLQRRRESNAASFGMRRRVSKGSRERFFFQWTGRNI